MAIGDKDKYTDKQKRKAEHIERSGGGTRLGTRRGEFQRIPHGREEERLMHRYDLRYAVNGMTEIDTISFDALTLGGALDIARRSAQGHWAELYEDGRPVCELELIIDSGVWLVGGLRAEKVREKAKIKILPA